MLIIVTAAVSLVSSLAVTALDVPYLPQSDALCGGAAAAMVFRYWGDVHASVDQFDSIVDRRAGGIADGALVAAVEQRGWNVEPFDGSLALIDERLARREPIIVLLAERGSRYHYVVVVGHANGAVIVHDPSWGPSRALREDEFLTRWRVSSFWALVITPGPDLVRLKADTTYHDAIAPSSSSSYVASGSSPTVDEECGDLLDRAIADVHDRGLAAADELFGNVRRACPASPGPLRELAGVRFAERHWQEASALAREALDRDPHDSYALDVLGSSLFMQNDPIGALQAWNQIGKPALDRVRIEGLRHSRYQAIADALHLTPGRLLTADAFERARRRLDELPDRAAARIDLRPAADGFAVVDIVIAERSAVPRTAMDWSAVAVEAAVDRQVDATLPGFTGQGEAWVASWRWWTNRPRVDLGFAAPNAAGLPGIWRFDASWDVQTYAFANSSALLRESRTHALLSVGDWLSANWRYSIGAGFDAWSGGRHAGSVGAAIERRLAHDRVSLLANGETWIAPRGVPGFSATSLRATWTSPLMARGWSYAASAGAQHVTDGAPLGLWPGAGDGHARSDLLRAHPMLDDGVINVTGAVAFGRTLTFGNVEAQRWFESRWPMRFGVAAFGDLARAMETADARDSVAQIDVGGGLRVRIPGVRRVLRIDVAHGIRDGANALTVGWVF
jgi:predicted double-glycine peptidase